MYWIRIIIRIIIPYAAVKALRTTGYIWICPLGTVKTRGWRNLLSQRIVCTKQIIIFDEKIKKIHLIFFTQRNSFYTAKNQYYPKMCLQDKFDKIFKKFVLSVHYKFWGMYKKIKNLIRNTNSVNFFLP